MLICMGLAAAPAAYCIAQIPYCGSEEFWLYLSGFVHIQSFSRNFWNIIYQLYNVYIYIMCYSEYPCLTKHFHFTHLMYFKCNIRSILNQMPLIMCVCVCVCVSPRKISRRRGRGWMRPWCRWGLSWTAAGTRGTRGRPSWRPPSKSESPASC